MGKKTQSEPSLIFPMALCDQCVDMTAMVGISGIGRLFAGSYLCFNHLDDVRVCVMYKHLYLYVCAGMAVRVYVGISFQFQPTMFTRRQSSNSFRVVFVRAFR